MARRKSRSSRSETQDEFLPEAELEVLACLHELEQAEASQVRKKLESFRPMSHASVVTLLGRLEDKGLVEHRKADRGKAFLYSATRDPQVTYRSVVQRVRERVFNNRRLAMVATLFEGEPPNAAELKELRRLVRRLDEADNGGTKSGKVSR